MVSLLSWFASVPLARRVYRTLRPVQKDKATTAAEKFIRGRITGFFVQIGSNDGLSGDPIYEHITEGDWSGVVVEPLPDLFEKLEATYRDRPQVRAIRAAINSLSGEMILFRVEGRHPSDPWWADQLASFDRGVIMKHVDSVPNLSERVKPVLVLTMTWDELLAKIERTQIDLLHVDTEGHDYEVLRQIHWNSPAAPTAVLYEHKHLKSSDIRSAKRMFETANYELTVGQGDTFCQRRQD